MLSIYNYGIIAQFLRKRDSTHIFQLYRSHIFFFKKNINNNSITFGQAHSFSHYVRYFRKYLFHIKQLIKNFEPLRLESMLSLRTMQSYNFQCEVFSHRTKSKHLASPNKLYRKVVQYRLFYTTQSAVSFKINYPHFNHRSKQLCENWRHFSVGFENICKIIQRKLKWIRYAILFSSVIY